MDEQVALFLAVRQVGLHYSRRVLQFTHANTPLQTLISSSLPTPPTPCAMIQRREGRGRGREEKRTKIRARRRPSSPFLFKNRLDFLSSFCFSPSPWFLLTVHGGSPMCAAVWGQSKGYRDPRRQENGGIVVWMVAVAVAFDLFKGKS